MAQNYWNDKSNQQFNQIVAVPEGGWCFNFIQVSAFFSIKAQRFQQIPFFRLRSVNVFRLSNLRYSWHLSDQKHQIYLR